MTVALEKCRSPGRPDTLVARSKASLRSAGILMLWWRRIRDRAMGAMFAEKSGCG